MITLWIARIVVACLPFFAFAGIVSALILVSIIFGFSPYTRTWEIGPSF